MQKLSSLAFIVVAAVSLAWSGCSGGSDANQNQNTATQFQEFTDANTALAEGTKFLDAGEIDNAINALNQAVKLNPDLAEAWFKLGIAFGLSEIRDETLGETNTDAPPSDKPGRVKPNSEKAFQKAVTAYKKIIDANPEDDAAYFNLGRAYNKLNDDEDAARALRQAVKLKPEDTEYQTELGAILIKLAQYHEAIAPLKKALEIDPDNIRAQELLEDAEAGRLRVNYSSTPKDDKKGNSNTNANTNSAPPPTPDGKLPPATPSPAPPRPRPTPSRPEE